MIIFIKFCTNYYLFITCFYDPKLYLLRRIACIDIYIYIYYIIYYIYTFYFTLLYHLPNTSLSPLNRIIRASIRTIFSINRFDHSITDSHQLISNWFPQKNVPSYTFYHSLIKQYIILLLLI